jgi:putative flippase GtrA
MPAYTWRCSDVPTDARAAAGRFVAVSAACALLHNAIVIAADRLGLHYAAASLLSFLVVVLFGYWLHCAWTFPAAERGSMTLARYALSMSANLPLFVGGMFLAVDVAGLGVALAAPLVTVLLWAFNFAATRWALRA